MFSLVFIEKDASRREVLQRGETIVGRAYTSDLVIDHPSVSRRQARLVATASQCTLVDLRSRNGTLVNGDQITEAELHDGDVVRFGDIEARLELSAEDCVALSEEHRLIESPGTIYVPLERGTRRVERDAAPDGRRLLRMLSDISRTLVKPQPLIEMLNRVADLACSSIGAERAVVLLADEATAAVVPRVVRARDGAAPGHGTVSRTIVNRAIADRVAILARDARIDTRLAGVQSVVDADIRSFMCVPLWRQDTVIGAFYVDSPFTRDFTHDDLDLFTALSEYAAVAIEHARLSARVQEETRRRERLQRYHSPAVVERILADEGDSAALAAQEREVSVVFCDLVGFTARSERMGPNAVARLLNALFDGLSDAVFEHEGTLDKFIGDAVMAVFGAPIDQPDHARRAVRSALAMRRAVAELNAERPESEPLEVRIAINSGLVTAGDIGSPKRREYTVLGDVVNTCARVQSCVCRPGQIVITRATRDLIGGAVPTTPVGAHHLPGREEAVEIFEVIQARG